VAVGRTHLLPPLSSGGALPVARKLGHAQSSLLWGDMPSRAKDARPHVIVVEDEVFQRDMLVTYLGGNGYRVSGVEDGHALRRLVERDPPTLVLLDLRLPGAEDGFVLARFLRERSQRVGIIMVTASGETVDRVVGLETGADDYIPKPFEPRELLARVKAVLRRTGVGEPMSSSRVRMGRCLLDLESRALTALTGETIPLRSGEFDLLQLFARNPNRPLTRDWLLETISHREPETFNRAIDIRILRIRRKIEADPIHPTSIRTVRSVGYMFVPPED
jgi:DNA-binding response OmpR family regulator